MDEAEDGAPAAEVESASVDAFASAESASVRAWLRSDRFAPWRWNAAAMRMLLGALLGLLVAASVPLPQPIAPTSWSEADAELFGGEAGVE